jgi:hypothetical protein
VKRKNKISGPFVRPPFLLPPVRTCPTTEATHTFLTLKASTSETNLVPFRFVMQLDDGQWSVQTTKLASRSQEGSQWEPAKHTWMLDRGGAGVCQLAASTPGATLKQQGVHYFCGGSQAFFLVSFHLRPMRGLKKDPLSVGRISVWNMTGIHAVRHCLAQACTSPPVPSTEGHPPL